MVRSNRYLWFLLVTTAVALTGAVLQYASSHAAVGTALLLSGDSMIILSLVAYLRRP